MLPNSGATKSGESAASATAAAASGGPNMSSQPSSSNNNSVLNVKKRNKLVMLGETSTGKTSLATRFAKRTFHEWQESTIGAAYMTGTINQCTFEIWDTAGQERYHSLAPMYYRGAKAACVVYDITSRASFDRAKDWIAELRKDGPPTIVIALVGNKADLGSKREVSESEAKSMAESQGLLFIETSAKTAFCVDDLFEMIAKQLGGVSVGDSAVTSSIANNSSNTVVDLRNNQDQIDLDGTSGSRCC